MLSGLISAIVAVITWPFRAIGQLLSAILG